MPGQEQKQPQKKARKKKGKKKSDFEAGKVFTARDAAGKMEDLVLDLEASRFTARKGQGGSRRT